MDFVRPGFQWISKNIYFPVPVEFGRARKSVLLKELNRAWIHMKEYPAGGPAQI
jgi:hypothetical protein